MSKFKIAALLPIALLAACADAQTKPSPPNLLKTEWLLEDLAGRGVLDRAQATLAFPEAGKVAGNSTCNRFFGSVDIRGDNIHFGQMGSTRMACMGSALANQDLNYLDALRNAERFSQEGPYLLIYSKGRQQPLRFTQIQPKR